MSKGAFAVLAVFAFVIVLALPHAWIGYIGYSGFSILCPQWNWRGELQDWEFQKWIVVAVLIGFLVTGLRIPPLANVSKYSLLFYTAYLGLTLLSSFQTSEEAKTIKYWDVSWKLWLMAVLGCFLIDTPKKVAWLCWAMILSQGWNAWNVNQLYFQRGFINTKDFSWNFLDNNTYSISTVPIMAVALSICIAEKDKFRRLVSGFVFGLEVHQLMLLQSRGTMLGALVLGGLAFVFMPKSKVTVLLAIVGVCLTLMLAGPSVVNEFGSVFQQTEELDSSASSRYKLWSAGMGIMSDYPLLGVGPWVGEKYVPQYYEGYSEVRDHKALHNLFFEVGTGCGIPAVIAYVAFFWLPWLAHLKLWYEKRPKMDIGLRTANLAVLCGVPGYWVSSMFSSGALIESPYTLMVIACVSLTVFLGDRDLVDDQESDSVDESHTDEGDSAADECETRSRDAFLVS